MQASIDIASVAEQAIDGAFGAMAGLPDFDTLAEALLTQGSSSQQAGVCLSGSTCLENLIKFREAVGKLADAGKAVRTGRSAAEAALRMLASPNFLPSLGLGLSLNLSANASLGGLELAISPEFMFPSAQLGAIADQADFLMQPSVLFEFDAGLPSARAIV